MSKASFTITECGTLVINLGTLNIQHDDIMGHSFKDVLKKPFSFLGQPKQPRWLPVIFRGCCVKKT